MRFVSAVGAAGFAYLALIPFALLGSTLDSACSGPGCESTLAIRALLIGLYAACLLALGGTALVFADHAFRARDESLARVPIALAACGAVVGVTLFFIFCLIAPVGGAIVTVAGIVTWRVLYRHGRIDEPPGSRAPPGSRGPGPTSEIRRRAGGPPTDPNLN